MTPKDFVPAETRSRLDLFTAPYWGPWQNGANEALKAPNC